MERSGLQTVLVESGKTAVSRARERGLKNIVCAGLDKVHFKKNSLPAVGLFDVLEHFPEDRWLLGRIRDHLKNSGRLYLTVPAYHRLWSSADRKAGHFRRYRLGSLCRMLEETGFKVEYSTYIFAFLVFPVFIFRTLHDKFIHKKNQTGTIKRGQFILKPGIAKFLVNRLCRYELNKIKNAKKIHCGTSCLIAARKLG
jgi:SAM-dependent methyltransferase